MKNTKCSVNWKKKTAMLLALAMVTSVSLPAVNVRAAAAKSVSANEVTLSMEDNIQVLVIGNTYDMDYELAPSTANEVVTFKSSKPAIATVDAKTGEITAKKRGVVTVVATTASGKKAWKSFYVVSKAGTTSYQATLNKMLASSNISKIVLKNSYTDKNYVIKSGDYSDKVFYVNAPKSDVKNYGTFKKVNIVDVADQTWREYGKGNSFTITDEKVNFVVASPAEVKEINIAKAGAEVNVETRGNIETMNITAANTAVNVTANKTAVVKTLNVTAKDAKLNIQADGSFDKVVIDSNAEVVIEGTAKKVVVEVTKNAKGAKIESAVAVEASVAADVEISLKKGAENSTLEKASESVALKVENNTSKTIVVATEGSTKTEEVPADTTTTTPGTTTPGTTTPGTGDSGNTTPSTTTKTVEGVASTDGKTASFTLPTSIKNLKSATVKVTAGSVNKDYKITKLMLTYITDLLNNEEEHVGIWESGNKLSVSVGDISISMVGKGLTKEVSFDGVTYTVTVNKEAASITVVKAGSNVVYTLSKDGENKLVISSNSNDKVADLVEFVVTY